MQLFFDTNILIELNRLNREIINKIEKIKLEYPNSQLCISWANYHEFYYGVIGDREKEEDAIVFLNRFIFLEMNIESTRIFSEHKKAKTPASDFDLIIASVVMANAGILITMDKNFENIKGLSAAILD